jgi:hypothetical protein
MGVDGSTRVDVVSYETEAGEVYSVVPTGECGVFQEWVSEEQRQLKIDVIGKYVFSIGVMIAVTGVSIYYYPLQLLGVIINLIGVFLQRDGYLMKPLPECRKITGDSASVVCRDVTFNTADDEYDLDLHLVNRYGDIVTEPETETILWVVDVDSLVGEILCKWCVN